MQDILVVGGGGYIGSHTCLDLARKGFRPVVYDNFSNGHPEFVKWGPLEQGDVRDRARLDEVFAKYRPAAVIHFAALIQVGESVRNPMAFFENNVAGSLNLFAAASAAGCKRLVFSSTCATYGEPEETPMRETHRQQPINPYGRSKLIVEDMLRDLDRYEGFRSVLLRYFNAAGADPEGRIGERHEPETHAIPLAIDAARGRRAGFSVFGDDYDTRDGSCVRDFIHVMDLADAHSRAVQYLIDGGDSVALNLGTGQGTTVNELLSMVKEVSGRTFLVELAPRREGDAPSLVADNSKARDVLGWAPRHDLAAIVSSAWNWHARANVE
ncbi:UDP-glucose 4-epimerase [Aminobacter sp. MSH1]|uniref:UDP-glucose 4-epimerase GalE n=1 Tax=Aminobacter sp. MSH1 TaxID=374606 RepID=UPI000D37322D|nr:UDP-glucose 4-epimerase GalE [Aminobacter sp. MSH1]AWC22832.1 UDP-glucose 4-epimerase [Aminobacter sp. MSH1]